MSLYCLYTHSISLPGMVCVLRSGSPCTKVVAVDLAPKLLLLNPPPHVAPQRNILMPCSQIGGKNDKEYEGPAYFIVLSGYGLIIPCIHASIPPRVPFAVAARSWSSAFCMATRGVSTITTTITTTITVCMKLRLLFRLSLADGVHIFPL